MLTPAGPGILCSWRPRACPGLCPSDETGGWGSDSPTRQPWGGQGAPPAGPFFPAPSPTFRKPLARVLMAKPSLRAHWGFRPGGSPHPQEEMSVRTRPGQDCPRPVLGESGSPSGIGGLWTGGRRPVPGETPAVPKHRRRARPAALRPGFTGALGVWGPCLPRVSYLPEAEPG